MATKKLEEVYVELDALLDTRLGTIARISDEAATQTLMAGGYHTRDTDVFEFVDQQQYKDLYAKRDWETLAKSTITSLVPCLTRLSAVLAEQAISRPYHDGGKIVVNTFPYQLTDAEQDALGQAIKAWIQDLAPVELVHIPPQSLTPLHCKQRYAMMIVYEYEAWMNMHAEAFKQALLPEVLMMAPAIYFHKKPTEEELAKQIKEAAHPLRAVEMLASPLIELKLINTAYFSIIRTQ